MTTGGTESHRCYFVEDTGYEFYCKICGKKVDKGIKFYDLHCEVYIEEAQDE